MSETWRPVVDYEGLYEVSDHGRVKSLDRVVIRRGVPAKCAGQMIKVLHTNPGRSTGPRLVVGLSKNGIRKNRFVAHLVLESFVGLRPDGMEACHHDDDPTNNLVSNLRWDTHLANMADRKRNGIWPFHGRTHCKRGHEFTPENTGWQRPGARKCKTCDSASKHSWQVNMRAAAKAAKQEAS